MAPAVGSNGAVLVDHRDFRKPLHLAAIKSTEAAFDFRFKSLPGKLVALCRIQFVEGCCKPAEAFASVRGVECWRRFGAVVLCDVRLFARWRAVFFRHWPLVWNIGFLSRTARNQHY